MTEPTNQKRRDEISAILADIERLHQESGEPVDPLELYEAQQAVLAIENRLRREGLLPQAQEAAGTE